MKRLLLISIVFLFFLFLPGCILQSFYPFYTSDVTIEMPQVHGKWKLIKSVGDDMSGKNIDPWEFSEDGLITYSENNIAAEIEIVYFKVGENYFVDCMAADPDEEKMNPYWVFLMRPIHSLCKLELQENTLKLIPVDIDALGTLMRERKIDLKIIKKADESDINLFTATPSEWVEFLKNHGDDQKLFNLENVILLERAV